jgi:large subunit ribosomal protein L14e
MVTLATGRICMKIAGREAGKYCVVLKEFGKDKENKAFVLITGPKPLTGVKRRKCNIEHLEALPHLIDISAEATDEAVIEAMGKAGVITELGLKRPSAAEMKAEKEVEKTEKKEKPKKEVKAEEKKEREKTKKEEKEKKKEKKK